MSDKSKIQWTDATWNTITGCSRVSRACDNCYARSMTKRLQAMGAEKYKHGFDNVVFHDDEDLLQQPLRWERPRKIFVNSMSDTFHDRINDSNIHKIYNTMTDTDHHTYMVLTKRPSRMLIFLARKFEYYMTLEKYIFFMKHIYHGITVEDSSVLSRISTLKLIPPGVKFVSFEPLLEDVTKSMNSSLLAGIDWVIIGGESGPKARPMKESWMYNLIKMAREAGCKIFVKQMGTVLAKEWGLKSKKGGTMEEWNKYYQIREFPTWA